MKTITENELADILCKHRLWVLGDSNGRRADLRGVNLSGADLYNADLRRASLREADLSGSGDS